MQAANILWRLDGGGELTINLDSNVFWVSTGLGDLVGHGCSEEATFLGIVRIFDLLHDAFPQSVVVIQGLLPMSSLRNGQLDNSLWQSIQSINNALEEFCRKQEYAVFAPVAGFFLEPTTKTTDLSKEINFRIDQTSVDEHGFPSLEGWKRLSYYIIDRYNRIVLDEDQETDCMDDQRDLFYRILGTCDGQAIQKGYPIWTMKRCGIAEQATRDKLAQLERECQRTQSF